MAFLTALFDRFCRASISFPLLACLVFIFAVTDMFFVGAPFYFVDSDSWEHSAALAELIRSPLHPYNPHVASHEPSPRFMPLFVFAGWIGNLLQADVFSVYRSLTIFNLALLLLGLYLFAIAYFEEKGAPTVLLLMTLFAWGNALVWSNTLALRSLAFVSAYPSTAAMGLMFLLWFLVIRFYRLPPARNVIPRTLAILLLMALVLLTHVLTGVIAAGGVLLLALTQQPPSTLRRVIPALAIPCAFLLIELWPYYSTVGFLLPSTDPNAAWSLSSGAPSSESRFQKLSQGHPFYQPERVFPALGIALLAIPVSLWQVARRQHLFAFLGIFGLLSIYLLNLFKGIPLGHRSLLFSVVFGHIALTAYLLGTLRAFRDMGKPIQAVIAVGILCLGILVGLSLATFRAIERHQSPTNIIATYTTLLKGLGPEHVVMGESYDTWPSPTFAGKTVALFHINPLVEDRKQRNLDVASFFSVEADHQLRSTLIQKYNVTHLLLRPDKPNHQGLSSMCQPGTKRQQGSLMLCKVQA